VRKNINPGEVLDSVDRELWDCVPKYFFTNELQEKLKDKNDLAKPYKTKYTHKSGEEFRICIHPVLIEQSEGGYICIFPHENEETLEAVLKRMRGFQQWTNRSNLSRVKFTLQDLQRELKAMDKSLSKDEIERSLDILSKLRVDLEGNRGTTYSVKVMSEMYIDYLEVDPPDDPRVYLCCLSYFI